jgi:hypothetical protein
VSFLVATSLVPVVRSDQDIVGQVVLLCLAILQLDQEEESKGV